MAEHTTTESIEVPAQAAGASSPNALLTPEVTILILTWVTFFLLFAILYKFAWKPILNALDAREDYIKKSLQQADQAKEQFEKMNQQCEKMLSEADHKAKEIVNRASKAAHEAAKSIEEKAKEETQILIENAQREIKAQVDRAQAQLREKSAEIAVGLAQKILEENLDETRQRKLIDRFIKNI